jgi:hypothetical protein
MSDTRSPEAQAYCEGWCEVMAGADPRFCNPYIRESKENYAWNHGALDAMEAEDGDLPEPACAGY